MELKETIVFNHNEVENRIQRMAWEIYEKHYNVDKLFLAGISKRGFILAQIIYEKLKEISDLNIHLGELKLDKDSPLQGEITYSFSEAEFANQSVVIIDDVLNSGKTLIYGVNFFLKTSMKSIKTAVLVDRSHKRYPVKADIKGVSLSTTIQESVAVEIEKQPYSVILT